MPEAIFASAAAVKKALELLVEDCYQLVKLQGGKHIKKWRAQSQIPTLYKKMKNFRMVKTIWQVEKEVDLGRFYYPSKIVFGHERTTISTLRPVTAILTPLKKSRRVISRSIPNSWSRRLMIREAFHSCCHHQI